MTVRSSTSTPPRSVAGLATAIADRAAWLLPALVALIGLGPALWALRAQTFAIFGRDQGIFQYVAWALRHGEKVYRDIHEINGPLPHAWHAAMQSIGGEDEHVFRTIDTVMLVCVYALAALTVPRWVGLELGSPSSQKRRGALVAWVCAGLTILGSQYTRYDWWHTAQREGLYAMLVLSSLALQSIGHTSKSRRRALVAFGFAGLFTTLPWFGKPPCAIFAVLQAGVLVLDRKNVALPLRAIFLAAAAGAIVSATSMLAFAFTYEDVARGIEILGKVPRLHHTIWNETLLGAYHAYDNAPRLDWALASFAVFLVAFRLFRLPRLALLAAVLPIGGFLVFAGQGKAFPYHLHMLTLGTALIQLVLVAAAARHVQSDRRIVALAVLVGIASLGLGFKSAQDALMSPSIRGRWAAVGATAEQRASRAYYAQFPWGDYFRTDLEDAAAYLRTHTRAEERVQLYGFDPYLLFLARRKSATPVMYSFELNVDAALKGGPGARPTPELATWLRAYRDEAEELVLRAVEASPPAAFVLFDRAPFTHPEDAEEDFTEHCPTLDRWMRERYTRAATFGAVRIWLRRDVSDRRP